jgi:hypothetical protein
MLSVVRHSVVEALGYLACCGAPCGKKLHHSSLVLTWK